MVLGSAGEGIQEIDIDGRHFYYRSPNARAIL